MSAMTFDTLKFVETLKSYGFDDAQAKGMAEAIKEVESAHLEWLATKEDIKDIKHDIHALDTKLAGELTLVKWMLGILLAGVLSLILKTFF